MLKWNIDCMEHFVLMLLYSPVPETVDRINSTSVARSEFAGDVIIVMHTSRFPSLSDATNMVGIENAAAEGSHIIIFTNSEKSYNLQSLSVMVTRVDLSPKLRLSFVVLSTKFTVNSSSHSTVISDTSDTFAHTMAPSDKPEVNVRGTSNRIL